MFRRLRIRLVIGRRAHTPNKSATRGQPRLAWHERHIREGNLGPLFRLPCLSHVGYECPIHLLRHTLLVRYVEGTSLN